MVFVKKPIHTVLVLFTALLLLSFRSDTEKPISNFQLPNVNGKMVSLTDYPQAKGFIIIFTCNHCPFAKLYTQRMNDLNTKYSALNVPLLAINSMDSLLYVDESFDHMKRKAQKSKFNFPYLHDASQAVGKSFGAEHTPMAYVIWKEGGNWIIKYKGSIDNNGEHPELATPYIANAIDELLQNKSVTVAETESFGCRIFYRK